MPKPYTDCVKNRMSDGESKKTAQRRCAIWYYKKFGKTPSHSELASMDAEIRNFFIVLEHLLS